MRKIITYGGYFEDFISTLTAKEVLKLEYLLTLLRSLDRLPTKVIKHIVGGIYELRMEYTGNIYRVFFIFDKGNVVILFNGFQKKTQKTPQKEIAKAVLIKKEYDAQKQQ